MGKLKIQNVNKSNGIMNLKVAVKKLQKSVFQAKNWGPRNTSFGPGQEMVPKDVKEGYFAVIASDDDEEKRFVVPIAYLHRPSFQRLLERATEEYGFDHVGALMVPCCPSELEWMLAKRVGFRRWCMESIVTRFHFSSSANGINWFGCPFKAGLASSV